MSVITETRRAYNNARARCNNPKASHYENFGGSGIKFELPPFEEFVAIFGLRPPRHRLARLDFKGNYTIENVLWQFDPKIPVLKLRPVVSKEQNELYAKLGRERAEEARRAVLALATGSLARSARVRARLEAAHPSPVIVIQPPLDGNRTVDAATPEELTDRAGKLAKRFKRTLYTGEVTR